MHRFYMPYLKKIFHRFFCDENAMKNDVISELIFYRWNEKFIKALIFT